MLSKFSFGFNKLWDNSKDNGSSGVPPNGPLPTGRAPLKPAQVHLRHDQIVERAMQADNLVEHGLMAIDKRVSIVGEIINLSEGRDKIFKIFSSLLKLVRWCVTKYFMHYTFSKEILNRLKGASSATSTARAFLKLFTDWIFFRLAIRVYYKQRFGYLKVLTLGRLVGLAFYFSFNVPVWLHTTKLMPSLDKDFWNKASLVAYIVSTTCQFIMDFEKLYKMYQDIDDLKLFSTKSSALTPETPVPRAYVRNSSTLKLVRHNEDNKDVRSSSSSASASSSSSSPSSSTQTPLASDLQTPAADADAHSDYFSLLKSVSAQIGPGPVGLIRPVTHPSNANNNNQAASTSSLSAASVAAFPTKAANLDYAAAFKEFSKAAESAQTNLASLRDKRTQLLINFIKDGGDFAGAFNGVFDWGWSDLTNGLIGINSAGISLWRLWSRYSSSIEKKIQDKHKEKAKKEQEAAAERAFQELAKA